MKKTYLILALVLLFVLVIAELNIVVLRKGAIKELRGEHWKEIYLIEDELMTQNMRLKKLLSEASHDEKKILETKNKIGELKYEYFTKTIKYHSQTLKIFFSEQKEKVKTLFHTQSSLAGQDKGRMEQIGSDSRN